MITKAIALTLAKAGHAAPSADNSQPWHFDWDGSGLAIRYDDKRVAGHTFPRDNPATLLSIGAAVENIVTTAHQLGLDSDIHWSPNEESGRGNYATIVFKPGPNSDSQTSIKKSDAPLRHTNRFSYHKKAIPFTVLETLDGWAEGSAHLLTINEPGEIRKIGQLVKTASEIRFQTEEVHKWLISSLRFSCESVKKADGLDVRTLALPPGGGLLLKFISDWNRMKVLNRLGIYKFMAQVDSAPVSAAPSLLAVIASADTNGAIAAGRLLTRGWSYLNSQQIAVHPYYVISDQLVRLAAGAVPPALTTMADKLATDCNEALGLSRGERLHMLLRIGYPKKKRPPLSLRLPIESVFSDLSAGG